MLMLMLIIIIITIIIIIITAEVIHPRTTPRESPISSFNQKNMLVEHSSSRSVGVATREVLRNLCSEAVKSNGTKLAGTISGE